MCKRQPVPLRLQYIAEFLDSPTIGTTPLHYCIPPSTTALDDNPWWLMGPTLLKSFPMAKFIFTTRECRDWVRSLRDMFELFEKHGTYHYYVRRQGYDTLHTCALNASNGGFHLPADDGPLLGMCRMLDDSIMQHADALGRRVLRLQSDSTTLPSGAC